MKKIILLPSLVFLALGSFSQGILPALSTHNVMVQRDDLSRVQSVSDSGNYSLLITYDPVGNILNINQFSLAQPVPIELLEFDARPVREEVRCSWITETEIDSDHFEVEWSLDAANFTVIGTKAAAGQSSNRQRYSLMHTSPVAGANYYRLKLMSMDGSFDYSQIERVDFDGPPIAFVVFPNPSSGIFHVQIKGNSNAEVKVSNSIGELVFSQTMTGEEMVVDLSEIASGTYWVTVKVEGRYASQIILKR
jgi:Secretion system C-terminal sorting domain